MSILRAKNIIKQYPGTLALDNVSVAFESGKIHAFVGKNGSGKSTLLKIFSGAVHQNSGDIMLDDQILNIYSPKEAFESGIATVYQELSVIPGLTVTENIFLGRMPEKHGFIDWKKANEQAQQILNELEIDIPITKVAAELSIGQCQMIEIAKAMSFNPKVLQLDEPTSALANQEVNCLFKVLRKLKSKGILIIYVSHKMHELWQIADTCTVLRDGRYVGKVEMAGTSREKIVQMMFGNIEIKQMPSDLVVGKRTVLETKKLCRRGKFKDINLSLHEGEILGIAGMLGAGRTELLRSIFGAEPYESGELYINGKLIKNGNPKKLKKLGVAMTQESRQRDGLILCHSIKQNMNYASLDILYKNLFINAYKEETLAREQVKNLEIKVADINDSMMSLSGGNQQKVVVGNWLCINPKILLLDEPSRGIDIKAKQQIFNIIWNESRKGVSSILVSSELEELLEVCHRILIMVDGEIVKSIYPEKVKIDELYAMCMGG